MSEYLSKKAVLEYTKQNAAIFFDLESYHDFRNAVLSGAFDADQTEVQRLRVVLEKVVNRLEWWVKKFGCADVPGILFSRVSANEAIREAREALSTTIEPTGPYTVRRYVAAGINTKGQPEQHLMWKIKSLLENWDFRAIASELESEYDQGILLELVELCEMLTGAKSPRAKTEQPKTDKTCVMCGTREGKYLSTANRWFCEPCTDALPPVNANAAKVERIECPCCGCEISINAPEGDGNDV